MGLSNDLLSQFAKITKDTTRTKKETTVYGTVKEYDSKLYVQLDGSDLLTPIPTTTDMKNGERVVVQIKDHSATILGNMSSPSASSEKVQEETVRIDNIEADNVDIYGRLNTAEADITKLKADVANVENLEAINAKITNLENTKLSSYDASITYATIANLNSTNAKITNLETNKLDASVATVTYATIESLNSTNARVTNLEANKLDATSAEIKYANIDFTNIGMAAVESLFSKAGIIKDMVIGDTKITGELVGVTIKGDLIEANTLVADKLVVQGEDGLYYKLNTDGIKVEAQQTDYNSLNGSVIAAKSITASKINVTDLVAFGATIGGFKLTENSIYSDVKSSVDNTTNGIYLDSQGQIAFGNSSNFVKYYKDQNGNYKLEISADTINVNSESITARLTNLQNQIDRINEQRN